MHAFINRNSFNNTRALKNDSVSLRRVLSSPSSQPKPPSPRRQLLRAISKSNETTAQSVELKSKKYRRLVRVNAQSYNGSINNSGKLQNKGSNKPWKQKGHFGGNYPTLQESIDQMQQENRNYRARAQDYSNLGFEGLRRQQNESTLFKSVDREVESKKRKRYARTRQTSPNSPSDSLT